MGMSRPGHLLVALLATVLMLGAAAACAQSGNWPGIPGGGSWGEDGSYTGDGQGRGRNRDRADETGDNGRHETPLARCEDCGQGIEPIRAQPRPVRARGGLAENILVGPESQRGPVLALIAEFGGRALRERSLPALGQFTVVATFARQERRAAFAAALSQRLPETGLSVHWTYRFAQAAPRIYAPTLIGDPAPGRCQLTRPIRIGMIDGPVNTDHPALRGASVRHESLVAGRLPRADHGTAIAVLLVGEDPSGILAGFARGAELRAVSIFSRGSDGPETSGELLAQAIDRLVGQGVQIINMSITGPDSNALRRALAAAAQRGVVMVGAAGNDQARQIGFPASADQVVAVTAVDAARRRFRLANIGEENEFAAPGVDIYAARARGAGYVSGTSFAAPIVTALMAREMARGTRGDAALRAALRNGAEALGGVRRSAEFGWGLARATRC